MAECVRVYRSPAEGGCGSRETAASANDASMIDRRCDALRGGLRFALDDRTK
jgi:hypothetical protein